MIKKGTKLYSILFNKCPRCHEGDFMVENNVFKLNKAFKMHENCSVCGLKYMIEPSFFYGAMYVNYGLTVALAIITFIISTVGFNLTLVQSFIPIVTVLIITAPFTLRFSRIIWINLFVGFNPTKRGAKNE